MEGAAWKGTETYDIMILNAGGVDGWVEGADLVFRSKTNSTDYHNEMNSKHYVYIIMYLFFYDMIGVCLIFIFMNFIYLYFLH